MSVNSDFTEPAGSSTAWTVAHTPHKKKKRKRKKRTFSFDKFTLLPIQRGKPNSVQVQAVTKSNLHVTVIVCHLLVITNAFLFQQSTLWFLPSRTHHIYITVDTNFARHTTCPRWRVALGSGEFNSSSFPSIIRWWTVFMFVGVLEITILRIVLLRIFFPEFSAWHSLQCTIALF